VAYLPSVHVYAIITLWAGTSLRKFVIQYSMVQLAQHGLLPQITPCKRLTRTYCITLMIFTHAVESRWSGFQHFMVTHFNATVSTFCDWFWRIRRRTQGWRVASPTFLLLRRSLTAQSSCLSLSEVHCFCALWNETLLQSFDIFYASRKYLYFVKSGHPRSLYFRSYCVPFLLVFCKFLKPNRHFTLKMHSDVHDGFISHTESYTS
jgi:hypothetical protein